MDKFLMPTLERDEKDQDMPSLEFEKERRKFYECSQFDCLPRHLGIAIAMKNYWVYKYDLIQK